MVASDAAAREETSLLREMLRLAGPVLIEQLLVMLVGFSDTFLTGQVLPQGNEHHLAAVSSMTYLLWFITELFVFVGMGSTALVARFTGSKDHEMAIRTTNQSFLIGVIASVILTTLALQFGWVLVWLVQLQGEAADLAMRYLNWVFPLLPAIMLETVGVACLRGAGDTKAGLWVMTLVIVVNVVLSWALIQGWGPLPALGWEGVAIGTACGHFVGGLLALAFLLYGRGGLPLRLQWLRPDWPLCWRILKIGIPAGVDIFLIIFCQFWFIALINQLGNLPAAAHGVAIRLESLAYLPGTAFQVAAATLVGQSLGARDPERAVQSVKLACYFGGGLMVTAGVLFFTAGGLLARVFVSADQTEVIILSAELLRIVSLAMPGLALVMILNGALRGAGDTRFPVISNLIGFVLIRIPLTYLLAHYLPFGVQGAWWAMMIDLNLRCLLSLWRFQHGGWKSIEV